MEGYIMHSRNVAEKVFKKDFARKLGKKVLLGFEKAFRDNFIQESDFKKISKLGFNCLRVPFHYRLVEKSPGRFNADSISYLDKVVRLGKKYGLWIILDLHAACGCQNNDWHSDSTGPAALWTKKSCRARTYRLWAFLADRYKDDTAVAGYNLINEPVLKNTRLLNTFYRRLIKTIRQVDKNHILFVDGNNWSMDIACLDDFDDDNLVLSIHDYLPLEFTFNFVPLLKYPLRTKEGVFDKSVIKKHIASYARLAKKLKRPVLVGEFGVNAREGFYGEDKWLQDTLESFGRFKFHWTYWTYKAIKNAIFPDGIFSFRDNTLWVNRHGLKVGWETYAELWPKNKKDIIASWRMDKFEENKVILDVLKKAIKRK